MRSFSARACGEVVALHGGEQLRLQVGDDAAAARQQAIAAEHQRGEQPGAVRGEHVDRPRQALQRAHVPFVMRHVADPVLDGADGRHLLAQLQQRILGIALPGGERILEHDQRQVGGVGDALEMGDRHLRRLAEREGRRREHQQRRRAALGRHARNARRLEAAVGPDAVDDRQAVADLVLRDLEHAALLLERAGGDLGRVRVDGDRRDAGRRRHVAQMLAEARLVDGEIGIERQQHRRDDAVRNVALVPGHSSPRWPELATALWRRGPALGQGSWPA